MNLIYFTFISESEGMFKLDFRNAGNLLQYLEDDFRIQLITSDQYLQQYQSSGFIEDSDLRIWWENGVKLINDISQIPEILKNLGNTIEEIVIGNSDLEFIAKLGTYCRYLEFWQPKSIYHPYVPFSMFNLPFAENKLVFNLEIDSHEISFFNSDNSFKISFDCAIHVSQVNILTFRILAYSPEGFAYDSSENSFRDYTTHVLTNKPDVIAIRTYIEDAISYINASTIEELILKLSLFSNSLFDINLLTQPLTPGAITKFKYQD